MSKSFRTFVWVLLVVTFWLFSSQPVLGQGKSETSKTTKAETSQPTECLPIVVRKAVFKPGFPAREGWFVAAGLLDSTPKWMECWVPAFPAEAEKMGLMAGVARLALTIDEQGNVMDVKPSGRQEPGGFYDAAAAAARSWRMTPPPRLGGIAVKTVITIDIKLAR